MIATVRVDVPLTAASAEPMLSHAAEAYVSLVRARRQVHELQRAAVLGVGDDEALDRAVLSYRRARAEAARVLVPDDVDEPPAEELFARWLVEAVNRQPMAA